MNTEDPFHIALAKKKWNNLLSQGDVVIDATCGNGYDTLFLAKIVLSDESGYIYGYDIQSKAIENTRALLEKVLTAEQLKNTTLFHKSHISFSDIPKNHPIKLIVYNLGYLPGGDKTLTTKATDALISLSSALDRISSDGVISIMCYPGHLEGKKEQEQIESFCAKLPSNQWKVSHYYQDNRAIAPSFIWIELN